MPSARPGRRDEIHTSQMAGEIAEAMNSDRLDLKWNIDGARLKSRIDRASYAVRTSIGEMTEAFWRDETGDGYRAVIDRLKRGFTEWERTTAPAIRKDRLSPDKMGEISQTEKGPADKQKATPAGGVDPDVAPEIETPELRFPDPLGASEHTTTEEHPMPGLEPTTIPERTTAEQEASEQEASEQEASEQEASEQEASEQEASEQADTEGTEEEEPTTGSAPEQVGAIDYENAINQQRGRAQPAGRPGPFNRPGR